MKKILMYGLGTLTVVTWSVAAVLLLPKEEAVKSGAHSEVRTPVLLEENVDFAGVTEQINALNSTGKVRTVFGEQTITDEWKEDVEDNGRVSIDAVLGSLSTDDS